MQAVWCLVQSGLTMAISAWHSGYGSSSNGAMLHFMSTNAWQNVVALVCQCLFYQDNAIDINAFDAYD